MAVALLIGFYALALGISGALLWIPYAEYTYLGRVHFKIAGLCVGGAGALLWALVPRADTFMPPGPQLTRAGSPKLFSVIDDVARRTAQAPPSEVYLLNEVNAWVTHRGGMMGFGSRRVMGVGLPLLAHLSASELKAVIAHEFGHYVSGDVSLGPWIYKTRSAIGRALAATQGTVLAAPFDLYAKLFLKTTLAVSRQQEFEADRTAARVSGAAPMTRALQRVAALAPAYPVYLRSEVMPVLRSGFLPPIADGFGRFLAHPHTMATVNALVAEQTTGADAGEFDTHPPMSERIAALRRLGIPEREKALGGHETLVDDLDGHATALLRHAFGNEAIEKLRPIDWSQVGTAVYLRHWEEVARANSGRYGALTVDQMPVGPKSYLALGILLGGKEEVNINAEERIERAIQVMTAGLSVALVRAGWNVHTAPGHAIELVKGSDRIAPREVVVQLADARGSAEDWRATCVRVGIEGLALQGVAQN